MREVALELREGIGELARPNELPQRLGRADGVADRHEQEVDLVLDPYERLDRARVRRRVAVGVHVRPRRVDTRDLLPNGGLPDVRRVGARAEVEELA